MNRTPKIFENDLLGLTKPEIHAAIYSKLGDIPAYRAKQIYQWLYARRAQSFSEMTQLPVQLRSDLDEQFTIGTLKLAHKSISEDGTIKFLFELEDGFQIESVLIPSEMRDA